MPDNPVDDAEDSSAADDDSVDTKPATSGHSDADSQTQRNAEDESPG